MMWSILISIFLFGYILIAIEHATKVNKSAIALLLASILWAIVLFFATDVTSLFNTEAFNQYLLENPSIAQLSVDMQSVRFLVDRLLLEHLGDVSETLFFLIGAMTVVELIDHHGGFNFITQHITTRNIRILVWIIGCLSFFLSALLDNLTTSIVMVMLARKIVAHKEIRWWICGVIILSANAGGAWSPIGDVTTIMLWVKGDISTLPTVSHVFLPSLTAMIVPLLFIHYRLRGVVDAHSIPDNSGRFYDQLPERQRLLVLILGVCGLLFVPICKSISGLPPFMGILLVLGVLWVYTEIVYTKHVDIEEHKQNRVSRVLSHIDMSTILFFLGILLAVAALQVSGILDYAATQLNEHLHNIYIINGLIGIFSSIVDNVPLVAAAMGMYAIPTATELANSTDPTFMSLFVQDGTFWQLLAYCAGVGGSILIIGSAAGVVVMGLEKITFNWYLKSFSLFVLIGYLAGIGVFFAQEMILTMH